MEALCDSERQIHADDEPAALKERSGFWGTVTELVTELNMAAVPLNEFTLHRCVCVCMCVGGVGAGGGCTRIRPVPQETRSTSRVLSLVQVQCK